MPSVPGPTQGACSRRAVRSPSPLLGARARSRLPSRTPQHISRAAGRRMCWGTGRIGRWRASIRTVPCRRCVGEHHAAAQDIHHASRLGGVAHVGRWRPAASALSARRRSQRWMACRCRSRRAKCWAWSARAAAANPHSAGLALRLLHQSGGSVEFDGADLARFAGADLGRFRKQAQIVFQNVGSSLNPRLSVGEAIERPLALFGLAKPRATAKRVEELLDMVRLPPSLSRRAIRISSAAANGSALRSRARWRPSRASSSATNRSPRSMSRCRRRSSICWRICATSSVSPICSSRTISLWSHSSPTASR